MAEEASVKSTRTQEILVQTMNPDELANVTPMMQSYLETKGLYFILSSWGFLRDVF